jgi:hypothetical protein
MLSQLVLGAAVIVATVIVHAVSLEGILRVLLAINIEWEARWRTLTFSLTILAIFMAHVVEIAIWAMFYYFTDEIETLEAALYFSTSSFTTVGYGDLVLSEEWRLFGSLESANGMILFGWSTAFIFETVTRTYRHLYRSV